MKSNSGNSTKEALETFFRLQNDPVFLAKQQAMLREERKAFLRGFGLLMFFLTLVAGIAGIYLARWLLGAEDPGLIGYGMALGMAVGMVALLYPR